MVYLYEQIRKLWRDSFYVTHRDNEDLSQRKFYYCCEDRRSNGLAQKSIGSNRNDRWLITNETRNTVSGNIYNYNESMRIKILRVCLKIVCSKMCVPLYEWNDQIWEA